MQLNYKVFGQGKPIVILHGLFGTLDNWQTMAKQLATEYMVFIIDQRNHGRSPHIEGFDYPTLAHDLQAFMEQQWLYEAVVIGHSMGGKTAMQLAFDYPERISKLVVLDIAPKAYVRGHDLIFEALHAVPLATLTDRDEAADLMRKFIYNDGVLQFLLKNLSRNPETGQFAWKMNLPVLHAQYEHILAAPHFTHPFEKPTLFVRGEQSDYVIDADIPVIRRWFPQSELVTLPDAGHWLHAEQPKALYDIMVRFLRA